MVALAYKRVPRDAGDLYTYLDPVLASLSGTPSSGVALLQTTVNDPTNYAGDFANADVAGAPTLKALRATAGTHTLVVNGNGITLSDLSVTGTTILGTTQVDTLILTFKTVGVPTDPGAGLARLYAGDDGHPYWFPNGGAAVKVLRSGLVVNADIAAGAAIVYAKLSLTNSIVNADINTSAAIGYSKLSLGNSIVNADIASSAAIALSKLAPGLANTLVITDSGGTSIVTGLLIDAHVSGSAAIAVTKLAAGSDKQVLWNSGGTNQWTSSPTIGGNLAVDGTFAVTSTSTFTGAVTMVSTLTVGNATGVGSGVLRIPTAQAIYSEESGGTDRPLIQINGSNQLLVGDYVSGTATAILGATTDLYFIAGNAAGNIVLQIQPAKFALFGSTPNAKQTITGVTTGTLAQLQAVVRNILAAWANHGAWTDSTT